MKEPEFLAEQFDLFKPPKGSVLSKTVSQPFHVGKELASPYDRRFSGPPPEDRFTLYTDGSCARNPGGAGGWCAIVIRSGKWLKTVSGHDPITTSNRMELKAIVEGLKLFSSGDGVDVVSDSQYVVCGATSWVKNWMRQGWHTGKRGKGGPVKNADLWQQIVGLKGPLFCRFTWVRGHNGDKWNEECDRIAGDRTADKSPYVYIDELQ